MKKLTVILSTILVAASVVLAVAEESGKNVAQQPALKTLTGEVVSVDVIKYEIVAKDKAGQQMTFSTDLNTKFTKAGQSVTLSDIKAGDKVSIEYHESAGKRHAQTVRVTTAQPRE